MLESIVRPAPPKGGAPLVSLILLFWTFLSPMPGPLALDTHTSVVLGRIKDFRQQRALCGDVPLLVARPAGDIRSYHHCGGHRLRIVGGGASASISVSLRSSITVPRPSWILVSLGISPVPVSPLLVMVVEIPTAVIRLWAKSSLALIIVIVVVASAAIIQLVVIEWDLGGVIGVLSARTARTIFVSIGLIVSLLTVGTGSSGIVICQGRASCYGR